MMMKLETEGESVCLLGVLFPYFKVRLFFDIIHYQLDDETQFGFAAQHL